MIIIYYSTKYFITSENERLKKAMATNVKQNVYNKKNTYFNCKIRNHLKNNLECPSTSYVDGSEHWPQF